MTTEVDTLEPEDTLLKASDIFLCRRIRHLPVIVSKNRLVGLLSQRDLAVYRSLLGGDGWEDIEVARAMRAPVETASPADSLTDAAARMRDKKLGCLPIVENGALIGLVTLIDILDAEVAEAQGLNKESSDYGPRGIGYHH
jgi:acetoin utilization protein AcuB